MKRNIKQNTEYIMCFWYLFDGADFAFELHDKKRRKHIKFLIIIILS